MPRVRRRKQEDDMRQIGRTEDGETIVALSQIEAQLFAKLNEAASGGTGNHLLLYDEHVARPVAMNSDYEGILGAILAWTQAKFAINRMQELLNDLKNVTG